MTRNDDENNYREEGDIIMCQPQYLLTFLPL